MLLVLLSVSLYRPWSLLVVFLMLVVFALLVVLMLVVVSVVLSSVSLM